MGSMTSRPSSKAKYSKPDGNAPIRASKKAYELIGEKANAIEVAMFVAGFGYAAQLVETLIEDAITPRDRELFKDIVVWLKENK